MFQYLHLGVSITTYSDQHTRPHRYAMINNCLASLTDTMPTNLMVNIVSDGITDRHRKIIEGYPQFNHIERKENGGVSKAKNTSIRSLLEQNVDIGFLSDDDLIFTGDAFTQYAIAVVRTGIPHFCLFQDYANIPGWPFRDATHKAKCVNGFQFRQTPFVMGSFMTFTPALIKKVGYFRVFDYKFGHEHSNFTRRCQEQGLIPHFCDLTNSKDFLTMDDRSLMGDAGKSLRVDWVRIKQNELDHGTQLNKYSKCEE